MFKIILPRLLMIGLLVGLVYFSIRPGAGERQLQRTDAALKQARSWRMHMWQSGGPQSVEYTEEISCDSMHFDQHITVPSQNVDMDTEKIITGNYSYEKYPGNPWKRSTSAKAPWLKCYGDPPLVKESQFPSIRQTLALGSIKKGDKRWSGSDLCRDWNITFRQPNGGQQQFVYCISETDDLPREMKTADGSLRMQYTDWNQSIDIQPPAGNFD